MTINEYAKAVGVCSSTVRNAIKAGRLTITVVQGVKGPIYDIDPHKHPCNAYIKRSVGRPPGAKNKPKT